MDELTVYWVPVIEQSINLELYVSLLSTVLGIELTIKDLYVIWFFFFINETFQACEKKSLKK